MSACGPAWTRKSDSAWVFSAQGRGQNIIIAKVFVFLFFFVWTRDRRRDDHGALCIFFFFTVLNYFLLLLLIIIINTLFYNVCFHVIIYVGTAGRRCMWHRWHYTAGGHDVLIGLLLLLLIVSRYYVLFRIFVDIIQYTLYDHPATRREFIHNMHNIIIVYRQSNRTRWSSATHIWRARIIKTAEIIIVAGTHCACLHIIGAYHDYSVRTRKYLQVSQTLRLPYNLNRTATNVTARLNYNIAMDITSAVTLYCDSLYLRTVTCIIIMSKI